MFLHLMDDDQKRALIALAGAMVTRDGRADTDEVGYLKRLMVESGLGRDLGEITSADAVDPGVFATRAAKCAAVAELLILSILDGVYDDAEAALADGLVKEMGLSTEDHEMLCRIAEDAVGALSKMRHLVE